MVQSLAISFTTKNDLTISTGRIDFSGKISKEIHLLWSSQLDTTPVTPPFVIVNGENKYIAIQDNDLNLNFYNEAGRLLWKKFLGEKRGPEVNRFGLPGFAVIKFLFMIQLEEFRPVL